MALVRSAWNEHVTGSKQFILISKLRNIKEALRGWDYARFPELQVQIKLGRGALHELQSRLEKEKHNEGLVDMVKAEDEKLKANVARLISLTTQKAKLHWLTMGEETSFLFYRSVKERRAKNVILILRDNARKIIEEEDAIRAHILKFIRSY